MVAMNLAASVMLGLSALTMCVAHPTAATDITIFHRSAEKTATFPGCSDKQVAVLKKAIDVAVEYQAESWEYFRTRGLSPVHTDDLERFTTWFGKFSLQNYRIVRDRFKEMSAYPLASWTYKCTNEPDDCGGRIAQFFNIAGSRRDSKGEILICKGFWFPNSGSDARNGQTIIHEASHFNSVRGEGTNANLPETYGKGECLKLAEKHPEQAIHNADNYGFFAQYPDVPHLLSG
ncbi:hypothetical protein HGRIS_010300 [Hohenbuehelia grisea]|uniref:Lysine-specific metallo-endopeptidase domain-containing protein n=1 Tax=Hohenbuehelia grisea TaxID=104357 RepID=A0ABR3J3V8_9AGAR